MSTKKRAAVPTSKAKTAYGLLSEVRRLILAEPLRYDQGWWLSKRGKRNSYEPEKGFPSCGTVGCVAGWVVTLKRKKAREGQIQQAARQVLGLDYETASEFFDASAARGGPQTEAHAQQGAAHIARFQQEHAAQLKATRV